MVQQVQRNVRQICARNEFSNRQINPECCASSNCIRLHRPTSHDCARTAEVPPFTLFYCSFCDTDSHGLVWCRRSMVSFQVFTRNGKFERNCLYFPPLGLLLVQAPSVHCSRSPVKLWFHWGNSGSTEKAQFLNHNSITMLHSQLSVIIEDLCDLLLLNHRILPRVVDFSGFLIRMSYSKGPNRALEKDLTNETPGT